MGRESWFRPTWAASSTRISAVPPSWTCTSQPTGPGPLVPSSRGYWRAPEHNARSFTEDGFYRTGDVVRVTGSGHIVVEGRAKDQINRGGEKVAAEEVENHILAHPSVHDANVVAEPDPYLGERIRAYVVLRPGAAAPKPADIKRFVRERGLAAYKVPDRVEFVDVFPQTGVGKISKKDLRSAAARSAAASPNT